MTKYTKPMDEDMKRCMERLREINRGRTEHGYLDGREQQMLDRGEFFGGWEDADSRRIQLEPLEKFDHPELPVVGMGQPEWDPVEEIASQIRKGMAGAPKSEQVDAAVLRKALQRGRLGRKQQRCVNEMVASFRIWEMHFPFTTWGLSMYELALRGGGHLRWQALLGALAKPVGGQPATAVTGATAAPAVGRGQGRTGIGGEPGRNADDGCRNAGPALTGRQRQALRTHAKGYHRNRQARQVTSTEHAGSALGRGRDINHAPGPRREAGTGRQGRTQVRL